MAKRFKMTLYKEKLAHALKEANIQRTNWHRRENIILLELHSEGYSSEGLGNLLGVTKQAVNHRLRKLHGSEGFKRGQYESEAKALRAEIDGQESPEAEGAEALA